MENKNKEKYKIKINEKRSACKPLALYVESLYVYIFSFCLNQLFWKWSTAWKVMRGKNEKLNITVHVVVLKL